MARNERQRRAGRRNRRVPARRTVARGHDGVDIPPVGSSRPFRVMKIPRLGPGERAVNVIGSRSAAWCWAPSGEHPPSGSGPGDVETTPYLVMEFVDGVRFRRLLTAPIPSERSPAGFRRRRARRSPSAGRRAPRLEADQRDVPGKRRSGPDRSGPPVTVTFRPSSRGAAHPDRQRVTWRPSRCWACAAIRAPTSTRSAASC